MKNYLFLISIFLLFSCDDSVDIHMENNTEPEIKIRRYGSNHEFKTSISDSFRISSDAYIFECQILDEVDYKDLAYDYTFSFGSGNFEFIKDNQLAFTPDYTGVNVFNIKVTDVYGAESFANASIFVFDNLPPVAKLSITEKENYYEFDASESFDPDKNYGGYIIQYKLTINGTQPIYRKEPIINFQGLFIDNPTVVKLAVQDNDSAWSEEINQILYP